jgi:hypothetical protein
VVDESAFCRRPLLPARVALSAAVVAALFLRADAGGARGQKDEPIRPGALVPNIAVRAEPAQSYALYLPATYDPQGSGRHSTRSTPPLGD